MGRQCQLDWKTLLAYISGSVDEELLLRNEYLVAKNGNEAIAKTI